MGELVCTTRVLSVFSPWFLIATVGDAGANQTGWWDICNHCSSASQFRIAALNAPAPDGIIFVSNSDTLETRKFVRTTYYEDFSNGVVQVRDVTPVTMTIEEVEVFSESLERGKAHTVIYPRGNLSFWDLNDYVPQSVLYEIQSGYVPNSFLNSVWSQLSADSYFPTTGNLSAGVGVEIPGFSVNGQIAGSRFRHAPLRVVINYSDGGRIEFMVSADGERFYSFSVSDKDGIEIPIVNPDGPVFQLNGPVFDNRTFNFGPEVDSARQNFGNWLNTATSGSALDCAVTTTDAGMRVTCVRTD